MRTPIGPSLLMQASAVAKLLGVSSTELKTRGPRQFKIGKRYYYQRSVVENYVPSELLRKGVMRITG